jgi:HNH endonuclease
MDQATRRLVRDRAGDECEYCGLAQSDAPFAPFQCEHVIPRQHGGSDDPSNLALACAQCNSHKGSNLSEIDPESRQVVDSSTPGKTDGTTISPGWGRGSSASRPEAGRPLACSR